jgi:hypothetical protein
MAKSLSRIIFAFFMKTSIPSPLLNAVALPIFYPFYFRLAMEKTSRLTQKKRPQPVL